MSREEKQRMVVRASGNPEVSLRASTVPEDRTLPVNKLLIIGIDGMDPVQISRFRNELPNIQELLHSTGDRRYESVFPPDSVPAWVSFFTGQNPAEHGILEYVDYLAPNRPNDVNLTSFRGSTFWDLAGRAGARVAVLNPFLAYPPWPVPGVMASGPAFVTGEKLVVPEDFAGRHPLPFMGGYSGFPGEHELAQFLDQAEQETLGLADYARKVWNDIQPDLLFVSFLALDRIQHFVWRYDDADDPTHPGRTPFSGSILRFYRLMDDIIGRLRDTVGRATQTVVMSDHGHGRRCTQLVNFNEMLRREGLLVCRGGSSPLSKERVLEKLKNLAVHYAHQWHLERLLQKAARRLPGKDKKALKRGDHIIDKAQSLAYASDFDGANPYGGICLKRSPGEDAAYEKLRDRVIDLLLRAHRAAGLPRPLVKWAKRREQVYAGPHLEKYPDVLFELDARYGVNWAVFAPLITANPRHRTLSGGHLKPGVLLVSQERMARSLQAEESPDTLFHHILEWLGLGSQARARQGV